MNILITGGAGFIGSALARALVLRGDTVTVLDNLSAQIHGVSPAESPLFRSLPESVRFIKGDVRRREDWQAALENQHAVIHLAAETGTGQSMYQVDHYVETNIRGTSLMLDLLAQARDAGHNTVRRVVVASSRSIYGEGKYRNQRGFVYPDARDIADMRLGMFDCLCPDTGERLELLPTDETSRAHPSSVYGVTKLFQEQLVLTVCETLGIGAIALRFQNVYGPGQSLRNPYTGILSIFSTLLLQGKDVNIFEDGLESRDFVYIDDIVESIALALDATNTAGIAYNVGSGKATSVLQVAQTLKRFYGANGALNITGNFRLGDIRHNYADLTKIRKDLDFEPKVSFAEGAMQFCKWVEAQTISDAGYDQSVAEMRSRGLLN
ncbi:NAD-dependent epimerase/dehydratase family protein [Paraburkholderia sp. ZP32-5]|uniref:NAD-dependent epimerase/dehydratase family protein n=1 Tax=Paraburkholderia sp. ZP32-5 TaxID=2883245 RepID=UPI001F28ECF5|nr:NAD-dependent epimerase/dehydratase family protein [Paraburkholderia sp. ZP32-5]